MSTNEVTSARAGAPVDPHAVSRGRLAAARALVAGYEAAVAALDPSDDAERAWWNERLADAHLIEVDALDQVAR